MAAWLVLNPFLRRSADAQEMLYTMYVPSDEETPARFVDGGSPKGSDSAEQERQGLLAADGSLAAPYVSHAHTR